MKTTILFFGLLFCLTLSSINGQENRYLKITLEDDAVVNFPPGTRFLMEDKNGKILLYPDRLEELDSYDIDQAVKLYVFSSWKSEPDIFEFRSGQISLESPSLLAYGKPKNKKHYQNSKTQYGDPIGVEEKRVIPNKDGTNDVSLLFTNGIIFYYKDGVASAWLNGETLAIREKYIIESPLGVLKLSYNPRTTVVWYVFEGND